MGKINLSRNILKKYQMSEMEWCNQMHKIEQLVI